jgi:ankyrin repeat protein
LTKQAALELLRQRHERVNAETLGQAASAADTELVVALLDAGIDVNASLIGGQTPLSHAAGMGCVTAADADIDARLATLDILIERGADVKQKDSGGNTILMSAVQCPLPVVAKLIAAGAPVSAANVQSFTPLHIAFANGRWDIADLLVTHGARLSKKAVDELFFEKPTDPGKLALIRRATAK